MKNIKINLSTDGLIPKMQIIRGVRTKSHKSMAHTESYNVYKNGKVIAKRTTKNEFLDKVAPGKRYEYWVRAFDLYDLEGPESNKIKEKSSYQFPTLKPSLLEVDLKQKEAGGL